MPLALILSSYVAAGRMGGGGQVLALAALGFDPVLVPTSLFGRSPAKGGRGFATDGEVFRSLLADAEAEGLFVRADLVITGHFMSAEQVAMAVEAIGQVRALSPSPVVVVDPILGDFPKGLYVKPEVAEAVAGLLAPVADWITPNAWEMARLSGVEVTDARSALTAARAFGRPALVTSVPAGDAIGVALSEPARLFSHRRLEAVPNGTGDLLAAVFGAGLSQGASPEAAAGRAVRATAEAVGAALALGASELPLTAMANRLARPTAEVRVESLS